MANTRPCLTCCRQTVSGVVFWANTNMMWVSRATRNHNRMRGILKRPLLASATERPSAASKPVCTLWAPNIVCLLFLSQNYHLLSLQRARGAKRRGAPCPGALGRSPPDGEGFLLHWPGGPGSPDLAGEMGLRTSSTKMCARAPTAFFLSGNTLGKTSSRRNILPLFRYAMTQTSTACQQRVRVSRISPCVFS